MALVTGAGSQIGFGKAISRAIANVVVFLVSDAASDIVGQVLVVSGGVSP